MVDNLTAHVLESLAMARRKGERRGRNNPPDTSWPFDTGLKTFNPMRITVPNPSKKVPEKNSLVSFYYLYRNVRKYQPDEWNSEGVKLLRVAPAKFKLGSKGLVTYTKTTTVPSANDHVYTPPHVYKQVWRCTPADYKGKIVDCPGIVFNCECARFNFTWNWVLWAKYGSILTCLNEPPNITNPRRLIGLCKHGIESLKYIKKNGR